MPVLVARAPKNQRAASGPISRSSSSRVMNSPTACSSRSLPVADEADPGDEDHLHRVAIEAERGGRIPHSRHRAVVVLAPDVDEVLEAAAELLARYPMSEAK